MDEPSTVINEPGGVKRRVQDDEPAIVLNEPAGPKKRVQDFVLGWRLLMVMGWLFTVVGLLNTILLWVPLRFGSPEYEFASVAAMLDGLPLTMMGLTIALASSRALADNQGALAATILLWVVAVVVVAAGVLYWLNVPIALGAVTEPMIRLGIKKSMLKVTTQAVLYPAAMVFLAVIGSRGNKQIISRRSRPKVTGNTKGEG